MVHSNNSRHYCWVFTRNNPEKSPLEYLEHLKEVNSFQYCIFQKEQGESGTVHYQGYIEFKNARTLSSVRRSCDPSAHWELRRGTQEQAIKYASKEDTRLEGPWLHGTKKGQGRRTDVHSLRDHVLAHQSSAREILYSDSVNALAKFPQFYKMLTSLNRPQYDSTAPPIQVELHYGEAGTGKTRQVYERFEQDDIYFMPPGQHNWFDGYDGQSVLVLDDFDGKMPLNALLRRIDRYPVQLPIKGSFVWRRAKTIVITSNMHPGDWYEWANRLPQKKALYRRFTKVLRYSEGEEPVEEVLDASPQNFSVFLNTLTNEQ